MNEGLKKIQIFQRNKVNLSLMTKNKKEIEPPKKANKSYDDTKNKTTFNILMKINEYHPKNTRIPKSPYLIDLRRQDKELSYVTYKKEEAKRGEKKKVETSKKFVDYLKKILHEKTQHFSDLVKKF